MKKHDKQVNITANTCTSDREIKNQQNQNECKLCASWNGKPHCTQTPSICLTSPHYRLNHKTVSESRILGTPLRTHSSGEMRSSWSEFANSRSFSSEKTQIPGSGVGIAMIARSSLPARASVALHPRKDRGQNPGAYV
jgi:hypothetical protein